MTKIKKVVVTGGSGLLGSYVVDELVSSFEVTVLDLNAPDRDNVAFHSANVLDLDALLDALADHDAVVHLAALDFAVEAPPRAFFEVNVQGSWNVFHAAEQVGLGRVVYCSSEAAMGFETIEVDPAPLYLPLDEDHVLRPTDTYGLTKQVSETIARSYVRRGNLSAVCLRPTMVLFPDMVTWAAECGLTMGPSSMSAGPAAVPEDVPLLPGYVLPEDAARCFRLALESTACAAFDQFNVAATDSYALCPTLDLVAHLYGTCPELRRPDVYDADPYASHIDSSRARDVLGWTPKADWITVLRAQAPGFLDAYDSRVEGRQ